MSRAAEGAQYSLRLGVFDDASGSLDRGRIGAVVGALDEIAEPAIDQRGDGHRDQCGEREAPVETRT